ncbi:DUF559 domain-containing protein [Micromonospora okii]|uniref:DUF559 domain-containing protein n=1 Tax=Micromonospora okii TaxID=1182970 RepID=UPI001E4CB008|nr:DUF559 domain-containing protein [Micromonospora okii]
MPPKHVRPEALTWDVFRGSDAVQRGLLTRHQLRGASWRRLRQDVYADSRLPRDHGLACRAALLRLPPEALVAGPSAAYLHGVAHAAAFTDDVHVLVPRSARIDSQAGIRVHTVGAACTLAPVPVGPSPAGPAGDALAGGPLANNGLALDGLALDGLALDASPPTGSGLATGDAPALGDILVTGSVSTGDAVEFNGGLATGSRASGGSMATGSRASGGSMATGSRASGGSMATGSRASGGSMATGGRATGGSMATGGRATGIRRTLPAQAAWESAVWLDPVPAVAIVDSLLGMGLTTPAALTAIAEQSADRPGGRRARWVFGLADAGAQSPAESRLRVRLVLAGLPRPVTQHPVPGASGRVLHPDLAWPDLRVAVEYDGQWHADADQLHRDRQRLNHLVGAGWVVLHVTSQRLQRDFPSVVREVRAALVARGWRR